MRRFLWPVIASALAFLCICWQDFYNEPLELASYDLRQRLTVRSAGQELLLGSIDEKSIDLLGPWPWPREAHALLLQDLFSRQASSVFLDLLLEEPRPGDADLAAALEAGPSVIGARLDRVDVGGYEKLQLVPPAPALRDACPAGLLHRLDDEGGGIRFGLLGISVANSDSALRPMLSPALYLLLSTLGMQPEQARFSIEGLPLASVMPNLQTMREGEHRGTLELGERRIPLFAYVRQRDNALILTFPVRFQSPATGPAGTGQQVISFVDLPDTEVAGRVIVIGENSQSNVDLVATPLGQMKGMEVHAQTYQSLLHGDYLRLLAWPMLASLLLGLVYGGVLSQTTRWYGSLLSLGAVGALYSGLNLLAFRSGWWLPLAAPLEQIGLTTVFLLVIRLLVARYVFAEFAAPEAAAQMLISNTGEELEAETVDAVVIVSDIRGYTTLSETRTPVQMLELLNQYHTATVAVYNRYGGRALTYQGDAQLVVFGYPKRLKDPGAAAVKACMDLQAVCQKLRRQWQVADDVFSVGAAVCRGQVAIGRLGAAGSQIQYTVIGDAVRRAHKIQSMSDKLNSPILVDLETASQMKSLENLECLGLTEVDGLPQPVELYRPKE
jgi:CHASE2 domain-containing sensor protein/class 3 adenylate cyclase